MCVRVCAGLVCVGLMLVSVCMRATCHHHNSHTYTRTHQTTIPPPFPSQLVKSCKKVVGEALFENLSPVAVAELFPKKFHKDLRELIAAVVSDGLPKWREEATMSMVSGLIFVSMLTVLPVLHLLAQL